MTFFQFVKNIFSQYPYRLLISIFCIVAGILSGIIGTSLLIPFFMRFGSYKGIEASSVLKTIFEMTGASHLPIEKLLLLMGFFLLVNELLLFIQGVMLDKIGVDIEEDIRLKLISSVFNWKWQYFLQQKKGSIANAIITQSRNAQQCIRSFAEFLVSFLSVIIYFLFLVSIDGRATILFLIVCIFIVGSAKKIIVYSKKIGIEQVSIQNKFHASVTEELTGLKYIKTTNIQDQRKNILYNIVKRIEKLYFTAMLLKQIIVHVPKIFGVVFIISFLFISVLVLKTPIATVGIFILILNRTFIQVSGIQTRFRAIINAIPSYHLCSQILKTSLSEIEINEGTPFIAKDLSIQLKNVCFSYNSGVNVLKKVSLEINANQIVGIVGKSGCGKSTLIDIISGLLQPLKGTVLINNVPLAKYSIFSLREQIGFVQQESFLVHGTILENIRMAKPNSKEKDIYAVAKMAFADQFIREQPFKYNTIIGDRGLKLSGGQKQRIALARALLKKPKLLLLDEATSALDNESECFVQDAIFNLKGQMTIIIIAHRLSTIEKCDNIFVINEGKIVEEGSIDKLHKNNQYFYNLYKFEKKYV